MRSLGVEEDIQQHLSVLASTDFATPAQGKEAGGRIRTFKSRMCSVPKGQDDDDEVEFGSQRRRMVYQRAEALATCPSVHSCARLTNDPRTKSMRD